MSNEAKTVPAAYSEGEKAFSAELEAFFGGSWCPPDRRQTRKIDMSEIAAELEACRQ